MRAGAILLLAAAAINAEAEPKPYTIGQVAHGYGYGVVTGVDYGYGQVSGYGAIGNRGYFGYGKREAEAEPEAYTIGQVAHGLPVHNAYATGHPHNVGYTSFISSGHHGVYGGYGGHYYGKREAEAEAKPYTIGQVHHGYGHPYGVVTGVDYGYGRVSGYGAIGNRGYFGYGKREAEAEPEAYTIGQVAHGLPVHNAYATGHPHNVGYTSFISSGHHGVYHGGHYYGKREAEAEPEAYTIGQVAHGLPVHNAYATGHPHNVGFTRFISYGHTGHLGNYYG